MGMLVFSTCHLVNTRNTNLLQVQNSDRKTAPHSADDHTSDAADVIMLSFGRVILGSVSTSFPHKLMRQERMHPRAHAFKSHADKRKFNLGMASSHQGSFKECVELTPNNGAATGIVANTIEWDLPKTGIIKLAWIKFVFSGSTMAAGAAV